MNLHEQIFAKDSSLWSQDPAVQKLIDNRLGWLDAPAFSRGHLSSLVSLQKNVIDAGFKQVVLLGMGGSSLAAEVFKKLLPEEKTLDLIVLDGTSPNQIKAVEESIELSETIFIVASKSGGTIETRNLFEYFYAAVVEQLGKTGEQAGAHFIGVTDGGSELEQISKDKQFFASFVNPGDIGGRYSSLSFFGLVPAALLGWNVEKLLDRADEAVEADKAGSGIGVQLGAWLAKDYKKPIDVLYYLIEDEKLNTFFLWIEQLVAESVGKEGEGTIPVNAPNAKIGSAANGKYIEMVFDAADSNFSRDEVVTLTLRDEYDLAAHMFHWEFATAVFAVDIGINPFDEPNVSEAKQKTAELLAHPEEIVIPAAKSSIADFVKGLDDSEYLGLLVYAEPNAENVAQVSRIQEGIEKLTDLPITINYGPRYLHSVGQLHKGGKKHGAFLVLIEEAKQSLPIPGKDLGFKRLCYAQALGDYQILSEDKNLPADIHITASLKDITV